MQPDDTTDDQNNSQSIPVPQDPADAGHDTPEPVTTDSPESLDEDISQGADREHIDPHHSITRVNGPVMTPGNDSSLTDSDNDGVLEEGESLIPKLAEDNDRPFSDPVDPVADPAAQLEGRTQQGGLDDTHQATDAASDIDPHQQYDEGLAGAAEASEPNAGNDVVGYDPQLDQRRDQAA